MMGGLLLLFGLLGNWALGLGTVLLLERCFGSPRHDNPAGSGPPNNRGAELCGLGLVLGIGLTSWLLFVWSLCGGPLGRLPSLGVASLGWILLGLATRGTGFRAPLVRSSRSTLADCCLAVVVLLFISALLQALLTPQHLWDERAIYAIKAAVLYEDRTVSSPALLDPDFAQYHPRYPLLIPLAEQNVYALLGHVDDRWAKLVFPLLYLGLLLIFAGVLARQYGRAAGWLAAVLLGTVPMLMPWEYGFIGGQADAPVACYHGIAVLYGWDWLRRRTAAEGRSESRDAECSVSIIIAGIAAGLTIFTKDEGIAFLTVDAPLLALLANLQLPRRLRTLLVPASLFTLSTALIVVPWFWHRSELPVTGEMRYFHRLHGEPLLAGLTTLGWSARHLLQRMFREVWEWGLQWWGMVLSALSGLRQSLTPPQLFLVLDVLGALAGLVVAGMIAPTPVEEHLGGSSHRFLLQITPVAVLFMVGQWSRSGGPVGASTGK